MATGITTYGDISPAVAAHMAKEFLRVGAPFLVLGQFAQPFILPNKSTKTLKARRYDALDSTPKTLTEGVTPAAQKFTSTDVSVTLTEYGDGVEISDVIADTHTDPVLRQETLRLGEQMVQMIEKVRYGVIKAGTNVYYANGTSRSAVNTTLTLALQRKVTRVLQRQYAARITRKISSTPDFNTEPVAPSYIGLCSTDCESAVRDLAGFKAVENYGQVTPYASEIGAVENVRYLTSQIFEPFADSGGAISGLSTAVLSTSGTDADVYPIIYLGRDAFASVALKGQNAFTPMVVNPKPSDSDPFAQRGWVTWKALQGAVILNDAFLVRAEVAVAS